MYFSILAIAAGLLVAGTPETEGESPIEAVDTLKAVTVVADRGIVISRTDTVSIRPEQNVSDVLHRLPGVSISDYGGAAGLKSVSLRGLGSAHTAIYLDGVRVGNIQSGQTDLGALPLSNLGAAVVDYAQNSISFTTSKPVFAEGRKIAGRAMLQAGSFGTWQPLARIDLKASDKLALSANASANISDGDFTYGEGLTRTNNDIKQYMAGLDAFGTLEHGHYHAKAGWNSAERGTPGSTSWPSEDRQNDQNLYIQGTLENHFSGLYTLNLSAKASSDKIQYLSTWGDSDYDQTEYQLNSSHRFKINDWWEVSAAADLQWDGLESTYYNSTRLGTVGTVTSVFSFERFMAEIAAEYQAAYDHDEATAEEKDRHCLSPSIDFRFRATDHLDFVAFARRAYRIPTFNELYYAGFGNPSLRPEDAWLTDAGLEWHNSATGRWSSSLKLNGFYNILTDKIISAPDPSDPTGYTWLPYNIGRVEAMGMDLSANIRYSSDGWDGGLYAHYSYQSALDKTPDSFTYGEQIPYVARHTASVSADISRKGWTFSGNWNARMKRYDSSGEMPSWNTLDVNLSKSFQFDGTSSLTLFASAKNICNRSYEIVRGYPVPGRNFIFGIDFKF